MGSGTSGVGGPSGPGAIGGAGGLPAADLQAIRDGAAATPLRLEGSDIGARLASAYPHEAGTIGGDYSELVNRHQAG